MRSAEATLDTPRGADASAARRVGLLAVLLLVLLVAALARPIAPLDVRPHGSAALPVGASGVVARTLARDDPRFWVRPVSGGFATVGAGVTARFTQRGVVVDGDGLLWAPGLRAVGRGDQVTAVARVSPRGQANEVRYDRGPVAEWYANTRLGLEQGFTLPAPPPGTAPVTLAIGELPPGVSARVGGDRRTASLTRGGRVLMRYSGLLVSDSHGRSLPAWIEASGRHLSLRLDDRGAHYPLRVDPFVQVAKLTASNGAAGDELGAAIAVSADTIAVGAPSVGSGRGAVYVFVKPAGGWATATQTATLTASDAAGNDLLGSSVAMSGDTIIAGAPHATVSGHQAQGAAYVFVKPTSGWTDGTEASKLTATDGATSDQFGSSVAIDGGTMVVGAQWASPNAFFGAGAAYVFVNGVQQAKLLATLGQPEDNFGSSVGVSGDTVAVGAGSARNFAGAVYVFVKPGGGWANATQTATLLASDGGQGDHLGISVGVSGDTVAAGATGATVGAQRPGAVYVFVKPAGGWSDGSQTAKLAASDGVGGDDLGWSLGIGADTIVAGAPGAGGNFQGAVYLFSKPLAGWSDATESAKRTASDETGGDGFGESAGVTSDGGIVAAGSPSASGSGAAYVFTSGAGARSTATSVSCSPGSVAAGQATTCTATVSDTTGGSDPTGSVAFSSDSSGSFGSGNSCALTATGNGDVASCSIAYTPAVAGTHTITARYGGDATHDPSAGSTTVTGSPGSGGGGGGGGGVPIASFTPPSVVRVGAVTTLNASASTDAVQYQWDLNGDGTTDVTCGTPQLQTQFLPVSAVNPSGDHAAGRSVPVTRVGLTVVSATGQTSSVTQTVSVANANATLPKAASSFYKTTQNGFCVGVGVMSHQICVVGAKEVFGVIEAQGCDLHQVTGTKDLSAPEDQAVIQRAIDQYNNNGAFATYANVLCISAVSAGDVPNCRISQQLDQRDITGLLDSGSIELYECRGPVYINGLLFLPGDGHPLVIAPQLNTIFWSHTEIDLNGKALPLPSSGTFNFHDVNAPLTALGPVYDRQSPPFAVDMNVPGGALPGLVGLTPQTATLSFARSTGGGRYMRIDASLALPFPLTAAFSSGPPTFQTTFTQSNENDLQ
ncbi:MAG TPA: Ig-like domain repeat protein, partial [Solirubrobacteraceae bacterium]|nr:Ig-like domain repeat protein [Solirubrobacteraceae bacterium]